jgi:Helix-turn-helix domain
MATLQDLKTVVDAVDAQQTGAKLGALRTVPIPGSIASAIVYRDGDEYIVTDLDGSFKEGAVRWGDVIRRIGNEWATCEDWQIRSIEDKPDDLLSVPYVAKKLDVDPSTIRRWIADGRLEAVPLPSNGRWQQHRILRSTLNELLSKRNPLAAKAS